MFRGATTTYGVLFSWSPRITISTEDRIEVSVEDWHLTGLSRYRSFTVCVLFVCACTKDTQHSRTHSISHYFHDGLQGHVALRHMHCTSMIRMDLQEGVRSNKCESTFVTFYVCISFKETSEVPPTSLLQLLVLCVRLFIAALSTLVLTLWLCGASTFG